MRFLKNKKGFTLMELLGVVGIIAVLCAISIPMIARVKKTTGTQQENDYAKSIFLAVQDNLTNMKVDGSIIRLSANAESSYPSVYEEDGYAAGLIEALGGELPEKLKDILNGDEKAEYVYTVNTDENFKKILPESKIDASILNRKIVIIFNPKTGDVLYVKYGDEGEYYGSVINTQDIIVGGGMDDDNRPIPQVDVINVEECLVKITLDVPENFAGNDPRDFYNGLTFEIAVSNAVSGKGCTFTVKVTDAFNVGGSNKSLSVNYVTGEIIWVLDSLCDGGSFMEQMNKASIKTGLDGMYTGCDVDISVTCIGDESDTVSDRTNTKEQINPCFAKVENGIIYVENGRQLQNLNEVTAAGIKEIRLKGNIFWVQTIEYYAGKYANNAQIDGVACSGFMKFVPLSEQNILFKAGSKVVFNGNNKYIYYLYVNKKGRAGLFEKLNINVKDLTLKEPIIIGDDHAGALAGVIGKVEVNGVKVQIEAEIIEGMDRGVFSTGSSADVGLLCGLASNTTFKNIQVSTGTNVVKASGKFFGLMAGEANKITAEKLEIEGTVTGADCSVQCYGGVAGCVNTGTYSGLNVNLTLGSDEFPNEGTYKAKNVHNAHVGGIFGYASNVTVSKGTINTENTVTVAFTNFMNCNTIGGIVGYSGSGNYSDITLTGTMNDIVAPYLGGAFGEALKGTYQKIDCSANMFVHYVWPWKNAGSPLASFTGESSYVCPAGLGYAGKFVGYTKEGQFTDCSGTGESTGKYANIQFLGCIECGVTPYCNENYYKGTAMKTGSIEATMDSAENTFTATDISFTKLDTDLLYAYSATLSNCTYTDAANTVKTQEIASNEFHYYQMNQNGDDPSKYLFNYAETQTSYMIASK